MGNICSVSPSPSCDDGAGLQNRGLNNTTSRSRKLMGKRSHLSSRKRDSMASSGFASSSSSSSLSPSSVYENDGDEDSSVWRRSILMGEKCEPPVFSGLILYDENGNHVEHLPLKSPTRHYSLTLPAVVA